MSAERKRLIIAAVLIACFVGCSSKPDLVFTEQTARAIQEAGNSISLYLLIGALVIGALCK